jgi:hypothetical protein
VSILFRFGGCASQPSKELDVSGIQTDHSTGNPLYLRPFVANYTFATGTLPGPVPPACGTTEAC